MRLRDRMSGTRRPAAGTVPVSAWEVRARLLAVRDPGRRWLVRPGAPEQVDAVGEWHHEVPGWERRDFVILMRIDDRRREVRALDQEWVTTRDGVEYRQGNVSDRSWTWTFGAGSDGGGERARFATGELKNPLRDAVTAAGWTWRGVATHRGLGVEVASACRLDGRRRRGFLIATTAVGLFAVVLMAMAAVLAATARSTSGDTAADGRVVTVETSPDDPTVSRPVIEFVPPGSEPVRVTGGGWSRPPPFAVGDPVPVRYPSGRPQDAVPADFWSLYLLPFVLGVIGVVFAVPVLILVIALYGLPRRRRPR